MVTRVSGFQAKDGTLFTTLEAALAYEKTSLLENGVHAFLVKLGLVGGGLVDGQGNHIDGEIKEWLIANSEELVAVLSTDEVKVERKPRQPRAKPEAAAPVAPVAAPVEAPAPVEAAAAPVAVVDPLEALAAELSGTAEVVV